MIVNDNSFGIHLPDWEQLQFAPATGIAGTNIVDDGQRFIYKYFQISTTAAQFWRYDTWCDCYQQLATPPTQTGTVANMFYTNNIGGQWSGRTHGAIYLFVGNGTVCYLYKYDVATNAWSANLGTTNVPAAFGTDCYFGHPGPSRNNFEGGYHTAALRTITVGATPIAVGATSATVAALPEAMPVGARLRFGTFNITITSAVAKGATALAVSALPQGIAAGIVLTLPNGIDVGVSSAAAAGATSIPIFPLQKAIESGTVITVQRYVVLTAAAAASATSITIASSLYTIETGATALYYGNAYLIGNNATQIYRYNFGAAAWYTTSANSGNPAFPALPGAAGAGCAIKWLPGCAPEKLWVLRGGGTSNTYMYDLYANTIATETYYPSTETFTTGTSVASREIGGKQCSLLIHKDATNRIYEGVPFKNTLEPKLNQNQLTHSTAVVGDKSCCITTPEGQEYYYLLLHSSTSFVRCLMIDQ